MHLIDTHTLRIVSDVDPESDDNRYAILSHTWEGDEVSWKEFQDLDTARQKAGFAKIDMTCRIARQCGLNYAWVDTCCINKDSSAELSESINSMFDWYKRAAICFALFSDVSIPDEWDSKAADLEKRLVVTDFHRAKWFTRGWTLQELIAPSEIKFYDRSWHLIADKSDITTVLSEITHIDQPVLQDSAQLSFIIVARRMSWAAQRVTTRVEDMAYCLLGIFGLNLPMLYGEGQRAFLRLQEEIVRQTNDLSILAWEPEDVLDTYRPAPYKRASNQARSYRGAFAWAPMEFLCCRSLEADDVAENTRVEPPLQMTIMHGYLEMQGFQTLHCSPGEQIYLTLPFRKTGESDDRIPYVSKLMIRTSSGFAFTNNRTGSGPSDFKPMSVSALRLLTFQESNQSLIKMMTEGSFFICVTLNGLRSSTFVRDAWPGWRYDTSISGFGFPFSYTGRETKGITLLGVWLLKVPLRNGQWQFRGNVGELDILVCAGRVVDRNNELWAGSFVKQSGDPASQAIHQQLEDLISATVATDKAASESNLVLSGMFELFESRILRFATGSSDALPLIQREEIFKPAWASGDYPLRVATTPALRAKRELFDGSGSRMFAFDLQIHRKHSGRWVNLLDGWRDSVGDALVWNPALSVNVAPW